MKKDHIKAFIIDLDFQKARHLINFEILVISINMS